jgi:hypothetical protein
MAYRAKAKKISQAVTRSVTAGSGRFFSYEACYGTKIQQRLAFVEYAEITPDARDFIRVKHALRCHGSIRAAVIAGAFDLAPTQIA